jgi:hypothetical protein
LPRHAALRQLSLSLSRRPHSETMRSSVLDWTAKSEENDGKEVEIQPSRRRSVVARRGGCGSGSSHHRGLDDHARLRGVGRSCDPRRAARLGRRVAASDQPDLPGPRQPEARDHEDRAAAGDELVDVEERQGLDLQSAQEGQVPGRHAVQRQGGLLQLQPLVQLPGAAPDRCRDVLLEHGLRGVPSSRGREPGAGQVALQELQGRRLEQGRDSADPEVGRVPRSPRAVGLRHGQPDGARQVQGRRRHGHPRRRLPADRHLRDPASDRHRAVQVQVLEDRRQAGPRQEPDLLG